MEKAKRIKRILRKIVVGMIILSLYTTAGRLYANYFMYATYYQTSKAAKILTPFAPIFDKRTEIINKSLYNYYGSYENFKNDKSSKIIAIVFWPFIVIAAYLFSLISWLLWIMIQLWQILWQTLIFMWSYIILGKWIEVLL